MPFQGTLLLLLERANCREVGFLIIFMDFHIILFFVEVPIGLPVHQSEVRGVELWG